MKKGSFQGVNKIKNSQKNQKCKISGHIYSRFSLFLRENDKKQENNEKLMKNCRENLKERGHRQAIRNFTKNNRNFQKMRKKPQK